MLQPSSSDVPARDAKSGTEATPDEDTATPEAATMHKGDSRAGRLSGNTFVGLGFTAVGAVAFWAGHDLAFIDGNHPGPGLLPLGVCILLIAGGVLMIVRQVVAPVPGPAASNRATVGRVVGVIAIVALTVFLFERVGFITSVAIMLAATLFGIERKFTIASVVVVVATPLICWGLFADLLGVRLPPGILHF